MSTSLLSSILSTGPGLGIADGKPSVALQDKLARCERQLGDWQACASAKTPEGKQIIQNLQTQIRNIESRIASANNAATPNQLSGSADLSGVGSSARSQLTGISTMGRLVDVFA